MPLEVFPHESFGDLAAHIDVEAPDGRLAQRVAVVPSLAFGDELQRRVADRRGICMGWNFLTPRPFLHEAVGPGPDSPWAKERLLWRVLPHVAEFAPFLGTEPSSDRERFALAETLADSLDQYGHFRPEMIRRWAKGLTAKTPPLPGEEWQRALWETIDRDIRADDPDSRHPAVRMERILSDTAFAADLARRYPSLLVLGAGSLDPILVEVIRLLAGSGARVTVRVLMPTFGFLSDLRRAGEIPEPDSDPDTPLELEGPHPLLVSMGRQSAGTFALLGELDDQYTNWPEIARDAPPSAGSLLSLIQSDIRSLRPPSQFPGASCPSLRAHACHGPRREMEVLRDEILRAFAEIPGLRPDEIHIVTPDPATYAPLVSAFFARGEPPLPVRFGERPAAGLEPALDATLDLLEFVRAGHFAASEAISLAEKPASLAAIGTDDPQIPRRWLRDSGLTRGLGRALPCAAAYARDRLIAGKWLGDDPSARYPDGSCALPVADEIGGDLGLRARFMDWWFALEHTAAEWASPADPPAWADRLARAALDLFAADPDSSPELDSHIGFLARTPCGEALGPGAIRDWLAGRVASGERRGAFGGHIAFGRFRQLQHLPCRVLAMVGLQDAAFPSRSGSPSWDLLRAAPKAWDRNPRTDDRQLFLDAILAPTDRLIITASALNPRTNTAEPFSSCVDELARTAASMGAGEIVLPHRIQPFAPDYFAKISALPPSFDPHQHEIANALLTTRLLPQHAPPFVSRETRGAREEEPAKEISLAELAGFWKSPAKGFLKACGIALPGEEAPDTGLDRPPLRLDPLTKWSAKMAAVEDALSPKPAPDLVLARLAADRAMPPAALGESEWKALRTWAAPFADALRPSLGETLSIRAELAENVVLTGDVTLAPCGSAAVFWRVGECKTAAHHFPAWLSAVLLGAAGRPLPTRIFDGQSAPRELPEIGEYAARALLGELLRLHAIGRNRPLPFAPNASDAAAKKLADGGSASDAVAAAQKSWANEGWGGQTGEGLEPAARLAWRDADPFEEPEEWLDLARSISVPLRNWFAQ